MAAERTAQRDAVVAGGRQLEFKADDAVAVLLFAEQIAALARLALDGAVHDFVVLDGIRPVAEVPAVVEAGEAGVAIGGEGLVRFLGRDFVDEDIAPANLTAVRLELDRPFRECGIANLVRIGSGRLRR